MDRGRLILGNLWIALLLFVAATSTVAQTKTEEPVKVTTCQLKENPLLYNHRLVEVTSFFSNAFEGYNLSDPACPGRGGIWYSINLDPEIIEGIRVALVKDARFSEFVRFMKGRPETINRATFIGRFFSGSKQTLPKGEFWGGYGHFGCCSLFAIQQVIDIEVTQLPGLDYRASVDQPNIDKPGCGYTFLTEIEELSPTLVEMQKNAEESQDDWIFTDPKRVATDRLAQLISVDQKSIALRQTRQSPGRFVYEWHPKGKAKSYMVVVSRPYYLSSYAADPKRVVWTVIGAYESSCEGRRSVTRIR